MHTVGFGAVNVIEKKKRNSDNFISISSEREHDIILFYNTSIPIRRVENGFARKK